MAVDELSQDFLRVLLEKNGDADTTTIRDETGMTRGQVTHRYDKLSDLGWIEIDRAESGKGERTPPKIAVLTDEGDQAIKSGEAGKKVLEKNEEDENKSVELSKDQIEEFHEEVDGVKNRLNVVIEKMEDPDQELVDPEQVNSSGGVEKERIEKLEREVSRLRETVQLLNEAVSEQSSVDKNESYSEENSKSTDADMNNNGLSKDSEVIQNLRDQQDYLREWMDVAERHMVAIRLFMDDNDEEFNKYLEMAEERQ